MTRTALANPPSRQKLLDAARELMLARGYAATSVEEVCAAAGVTKGCFFHYFESKDALGKALVERWAVTRQEQHAALFGTDPDPLNRVRHYFAAILQRARRGELGKGCLLGTFSHELADVEPIREACAQGFGSWTEQFGRELLLAKARHKPKADFSPKAVAEHFVATIEGAILLAKAGQDPHVIVRCVEQFKDYVKILFGK